MKKNKIIIVLSIVVLILGGLMYRSCEIKKNDNNLLEASKAELVTWKDKDGLNRARILALESKSHKDFLNMKTKDSSIIELQEEVKKMKKYIKEQGSVTTIKTETVYDTIKEPSNETVYKNLYRDYITDSISSPWINTTFGFKLANLGQGKFKIDSTMFKLKVINEYVVTLGREPTGFLGMGEGKPFADIRNKNPYTETTSMRTYQVDGYDKRIWAVGPQFGYGYSRDGSSFYVGLGVSIILVKF